MATLASASGSIVRSPRRPITTFSILPEIMEENQESATMTGTQSKSKTKESK
jgi:hypothetical protein